MHAALRRLARHLARRPAQSQPDDLPSVYLPADPAPTAPRPGPSGEPDWWTWPEHLTVHPLLLAADQDADAACARLQGAAEKH
ncbi:hypothetical protein ACFVT9_29435 [Kitasatospora cineracea]|uniref:hypothetical protein n=1 Tax=Kitasatospora cineracea TaxID=88074 RepID=UPI0036DC5423